MLARFLTAALCAALLSAATPAGAQQFQPGQRVIVRPTTYDREGEVVRQDADGVLVEYPGPDGRVTGNGDRQYFRPADVRLKPDRPADPEPQANAGADGADFRPGDRVFASPGTMEKEGRVVRQDRNGVLVAFPGPDGRFDPVNGDQMYFQPDQLRRAAAVGQEPEPRRPNAAAADPDDAPEPQVDDPAVDPDGPPEPRADDPAVAEAGEHQPVANAPDGPPLTQEEVYAFLKDRIGSDPWYHPRKPQVLAELCALIRRRGAAFRFDNLGAFAQSLHQVGDNELKVRRHLHCNVGPPVSRDWYVGTWALVAKSETRRLVENDTKVEVAAHVKIRGSLTINADRTYLWHQYDGGDLHGTWRDASDEEMAGVSKGGSGLVLEKARDGERWLIHERDLLEDPVDRITLAVATNGGYQEQMTAARR